jgi:hypothetical protein
MPFGSTLPSNEEETEIGGGNVADNMAVRVTCIYVGTSKESLAYVNIRSNIFRVLLMNDVYQEQCAELDISFGKEHNKSPTLLSC